MKLCISNIAWDTAYDKRMYDACRKLGYSGLEIAPTRIIPDNPYEHSDLAQKWAKKLHEEYGLKVYSCQSVWYGRRENVFGSEQERENLLEYSKRAFSFAEAIGANNIVLGCPKNRNGFNKNANRNADIAIDFITKMGNCAADYNVMLSIEANPVIYGTDFLNTTEDTIEFVRKLGHKFIKLNLDTGAMIYNDENPSIICGCIGLIGHIHISEPNLLCIKKRAEHVKLFHTIANERYEKAVSIEMRKLDEVDRIYKTMKYIYSLSKGNVYEGEID